MSREQACGTVNGMIRLKIPVIVEGKYDKARLSGVVDAVIITTDGFAVFNNEEKRALIRTLGRNGIVLLCDSDGGGRLIRSHLKGMLDQVRVYDLYIPEVPGKEKRKAAPSKAGLLGVEGIDSDVLGRIFASFAESHPELVENGEESVTRRAITKSELFGLGLNGCPSAAENRAAVCEKLGLPHDMTSNAFAEAVNMLVTFEELEKLVK